MFVVVVTMFVVVVTMFVVVVASDTSQIPALQHLVLWWDPGRCTFDLASHSRVYTHYTLYYATTNHIVLLTASVCWLQTLSF